MRTLQTARFFPQLPPHLSSPSVPKAHVKPPVTPRKNQAFERHRQNSLPVSKPRDDHDGPKGLLLGYEHVVLHICENGRLEKETWAGRGRGDRGLWNSGKPSSSSPASPCPCWVSPATMHTSHSSNSIRDICVVDATYCEVLSCPRHTNSWEPHNAFK